jgi:hypothetical protein
MLEVGNGAAREAALAKLAEVGWVYDEQTERISHGSHAPKAHGRPRGGSGDTGAPAPASEADAQEQAARKASERIAALRCTPSVTTGEPAMTVRCVAATTPA